MKNRQQRIMVASLSVMAVVSLAANLNLATMHEVTETSTITQEPTIQAAIDEGVDAALTKTAVQSTQTLQTVTPTLPSPPTCDVFYDFSQGQLNQDDWELSLDDEELSISVEGEALLMSADLSRSDMEVVGAGLEMLALAQPVEEISFYLTLNIEEHETTGGAGVEVYLDNNQDLSLHVGPNAYRTDDGDFEIGVCPTPESGQILPEDGCGGDYGDYDHFPEDFDDRSFVEDEAVLMRVVWTGGEDGQIDFYVGEEDEPTHSVVVGDHPISRIRFTIFAESGSVYSVAIDDLCVNYVS